MLESGSQQAGLLTAAVLGLQAAQGPGLGGSGKLILQFRESEVLREVSGRVQAALNHMGSWLLLMPS